MPNLLAMGPSPRRVATGFVALVLLALTVGATGGSAACNAVPLSHAGDGAGVVSGYTVADVRFEFVSSDPSAIAAVRFTLDAPATVVRCSLDGGDTWFSCAPSGGEWVCPLGGAATSLAGSLRIVAVD